MKLTYREKTERIAVLTQLLSTLKRGESIDDSLRANIYKKIKKLSK